MGAGEGQAIVGGGREASRTSGAVDSRVRHHLRRRATGDDGRDVVVGSQVASLRLFSGGVKDGRAARAKVRVGRAPGTVWSLDGVGGRELQRSVYRYLRRAAC